MVPRGPGRVGAGGSSWSRAGRSGWFLGTIAGQRGWFLGDLGGSKRGAVVGDIAARRYVIFVCIYFYKRVCVFIYACGLYYMTVGVQSIDGELLVSNDEKHARIYEHTPPV
jgi:hypothetical protein